MVEADATEAKQPNMRTATALILEQYIANLPWFARIVVCASVGFGQHPADAYEGKPHVVFLCPHIFNIEVLRRTFTPAFRDQQVF